MFLSNPLKSALSPLRAMGIQAFAPGDEPWDLYSHCSAISVNDTLLASMIPVAASATHPQELRFDPAFARPSSPMNRHSSRHDPRWGAHAAATAQVPQD